MAKSGSLTYSIASGVGDLTLELTFEDFRGQRSLKKVPLGASTTDADVSSIVADIDLSTNARIVKAALVSSRVISGYNTTAQNALERNISEEMALSFQVIDPANPMKTVVRTVSIPAMVAALELTSGAPDLTNSHLISLLGTSGGNYADGKLSGNIRYTDAVGTSHTGMNFVLADSHHYTAGDIVDNS